MLLNKKQGSRLFRSIACIILLCPGLLFILASAGCRTTAKIDFSRPEHHIFFVKANGLWQNSGVYARDGMIIRCVAKGKWNDPNATYGPEGNPEMNKSHLGVEAPANALIMKLSHETNAVFYIGKETNVVATSSSYLLFRNNVGLTRGMSGEIEVDIVVAHDADGDRLCDYEEIHIWKTNPLSPDTDGDGFKDAEEIERRIKHMKRKGIEPPTY